jgi:hypothetical protein
VRRARICQRCSALTQSEGSLRREVAVLDANFIGACGSAHVGRIAKSLVKTATSTRHFVYF